MYDQLASFHDLNIGYHLTIGAELSGVNFRLVIQVITVEVPSILNSVFSSYCNFDSFHALSVTNLLKFNN